MGWIIPLILLLLLVPFLLYLLPQLSAGPATLPPTPAPINTTSEPYDCQSQGMWSFDKKGWCCEHYKVGCPTPQSTTSPYPFDCNAGYQDLGPLQWVKGWSGAKKLYCCRTVHRGCPDQLPPPSGIPNDGRPPEADTFQYDCNAGYHPCYHCLKQQWSPTKMQYCCTNFNKGCQNNTPPKNGTGTSARRQGCIGGRRGGPRMLHLPHARVADP